MTTISDADRQAAADIIAKGVSHPPLLEILDGRKDDWFVVQHFAAHRALGHREAVAEVVAAIRARAGDIEPRDPDGDDPPAVFNVASGLVKR